MRRTHAVQSVLVLAAVAILAVAVATAGATGKATAGGHRATAVAASKTAVIRTAGREVFKPNPGNPPNKEDVVTLGWSPGTITVKSGQKLTLVDRDNFGDPHVLVISPKKDLPKGDTPATVKAFLAAHEMFKALTANRGKPGLNTIGDALVLTHKGAKVSAIVSAKPGTTLYYFCAVHFWMQGKIIVK